MNQKVKICISLLLLVFIANCEVTVSATDSGSIHEISFKSPTEDTSKHIRIEYSLTLPHSFAEAVGAYAFCGTHDEGDTLLTNNGHPGFHIQHSCTSSGGCDPGSANDIGLTYEAGKCQ